MNVLLLTKYGQLAASTRYRYLQFQAHLESVGIHCHLSPLLDNDYLRGMFAGKRPLGPAARALARRTWAVLTARRYDKVVVHCEAQPYLPPVFEWLLVQLGVPYVYDFDDAIFHQYDAHPNGLVRCLFSGKIRRVIRGATAVIAGNEYLASYARQANSNVTVIPTVVDTTRYLPGGHADARNGRLVIGWVGSPSTAKFLLDRVDALRTVCRNTGARLVLVGAGPLDLPGVPVEIRPWREEAEVEDIQGFDIGIMPIPDTPWTRGKCGFKLIQYMACGLPVVASPVGVNSDIVDDGHNGFLAGSDERWVASLCALAASAAQRRQFGEAGREKVVRRYSVDVAAPLLAAVLAERPPAVASAAGVLRTPTAHQ